MLQWYDDLPGDLADAFIYLEKDFRSRFLTEPIGQDGMINYVLYVLIAKRELEARGLSIPLDWHLRSGFDAADLNRELVARFKRPFDRKMFESFCYGVQAASLALVQRQKRGS
ncbi:hypothetical protein [Bradyrhizobium sp. HKCCYLR1023]|uniref:hypothetical protein n=1 Tax=Bradyrhizobium TaxID=374 RepID=UPI003EBC6E5B